MELALPGFPGGSESKEFACNEGDPGSIPGSGISPEKELLEKNTPVFLPGKSPGQRSLAGYSSWGPKESDTTEQLTLTHMESPALLQEFAQDHNRERFLFLWSEITRYPRADIVPETKQAFRN